MTDLIVKDLAVGTECDEEARLAVRGGIGDIGLGVLNAGSTSAAQGNTYHGDVLNFASPHINNQVVLDLDMTTIAAPITELSTSLTNLTAIGSILGDIDLGL